MQLAWTDWKRNLRLARIRGEYLGLRRLLLPATHPPKPVALPVFKGKGLQPGVDLDDAASLLDLMQAGDASR